MDLPALLEQFLGGWINVIRRAWWAFEQGQTVTIIRSDGPFDVPDTLPGGVTTLESVQHTFSDGKGLIIARVLEKQ